MSQHLSVRVDEDVLARLDSESRRVGRSRSWLAKRLLDEGLRMERHPGIVFRSGPAGRRAGLMSGPDVWEVVRAAVGYERTREDGAEQAGLTPEQVGVALRYYAEHSNEIEDWIRMVDEEAERAEADWRSEQQLLAR
ncbi:MAG: ribbon-helix-helix protein, CopG family [bacterium]|nr:ribbon-helix-helix protein, CopG family [bacterium]